MPTWVSVHYKQTLNFYACEGKSNEFEITNEKEDIKIIT